MYTRSPPTGTKKILISNLFKTHFKTETSETILWRFDRTEVIFRFKNSEDNFVHKK